MGTCCDVALAGLIGLFCASVAGDFPNRTGISHEDFNPWDDRELEEDSHRRNFAFAFFGEGLHNLAVI